MEDDGTQLGAHRSLLLGMGCIILGRDQGGTHIRGKDNMGVTVTVEGTQEQLLVTW